MPKGPKGQKRPADVIGNAIKVARIATGEGTEDMPDDGKDPAAKALGSRGGKARAQALTKKRRIEIARKAAKSRCYTDVPVLDKWPDAPVLRKPSLPPDIIKALASLLK